VLNENRSMNFWRKERTGLARKGTGRRCRVDTERDPEKIYLVVATPGGKGAVLNTSLEENRCS